MATALSYGGSWFCDRRSPTGGPFGLNTVANNILAATMLVGVGTGTFVDDLDWWQQHRSNDASVRSSRVPIFENASVRTPVEDISRIREIFSPSISNLANIFGVSRQAVYNWLSGEQPSPEHIAKLRDLAQSADLLAETGTPVTGALLKRRVVEGKTLLEVAHDGGSTRDAAQVLVQIIRRETAQREMMAARFAGRKTSLRSAESDFPAENDAG